MGRSKTLRWLLFAIGLWGVTSCAKQGPQPIAYGKDSCENCGMIASDPRFGAEIVTRKGKILKFDSAECLAGYLNKTGEKGGTCWVVDCGNPSRLIDATKAFYLVSDRIKSPMGLNLSAFERREAAGGKGSPGTTLSWSDVLKYVKQKWG